jgi:type VI secretion system protein ImpL
VPGAQVTAYFAPIHALVAGEAGAAPIDLVLGKVQQLQQQISPVGQAVGSTNPIDAITRSGSGELVKAIRQDAAALPPTVGTMVTSIADRAAGAVRADVRGELETRYLQDVVAECRDIVNDRYPFFRTSAVDVSPQDFGRLLGHDGVFDRFFKQRMESLVNTTRRPWSWRPDASGVAVVGSTRMLRQFEAAQRIRDTYFSMGGQVPRVQFTVTPTTLDPDTGRFVLDIDGQRSEYQHGPERALPIVWPGPRPGEAAVTFEEKGGRRPNTAVKGTWAWLRLFDAAELKAETDRRYLATWRRDNHEATVVIEAVSIDNPFDKSDLQQFRCE